MSTSGARSKAELWREVKILSESGICKLQKITTEIYCSVYTNLDDHLLNNAPHALHRHPAEPPRPLEVHPVGVHDGTRRAHARALREARIARLHILGRESAG